MLKRCINNCEVITMRKVIENYCLNCHDNTKWTQFSFSNEIPNYHNSGNTAVFITYTCDKCGNKNTYYHMKD